MGFLSAIKSALNWPAYGGQGLQRHGIADWVTWTGTQGYNYVEAAGELHRNGVVMACASWLMRSFPEPPVQVVREEGDTGEENEVPRHPLTLALRKPNPFYGGTCLMQRLIFDRAIHGQAFLFKERNGAGQPVNLWHVPQHRLMPQWPPSGKVFVDHYLFVINGVTSRVETRDLVHFRFGGDPHYERNGIAPVGAALREVATLNEGANYRGAILKNMGVPSHILQGKDPARPITPEQAKGLHALWAERVSGGNRGKPIIPAWAMEAIKIGMSPAELDIGSMTYEAADLIASLFGLSSQVVGLSSGSAHKTYANQKEAKESATENALVPAWTQMAEDLTLQLLPDYSDDEAECVKFDLSKVRALQEDQDALWTRVDAAVKTGWVTPNEGRALVNLPAIDGGDELPIVNPPAPPVGGFPGQGDGVQAEQPGAPATNGNGRESRGATLTGRVSTNGKEPAAAGTNGRA